MSRRRPPRIRLVSALDLDAIDERAIAAAGQPAEVSDEGRACRDCGDDYQLDYGKDPSSLCHACAQETADAYGRDVPALVAEVRRLRKELLHLIDGIEMNSPSLDDIVTDLKTIANGGAS